MEHEVQIRVRYEETDQMGVVYHANYFTYFEVGRTELLRSRGITYEEVEKQGLFCVVVHAECRYKKPAKYDDLLTLKTIVKRVGRVRIEHEYHLFRGDELLVVGSIVLVTVDRDGRIQPVPDILLLKT